MPRPLPSQKTRAPRCYVPRYAKRIVSDLIDLEKRGMMSDHFGITTAQAFLKEKQRHLLAREPGSIMRLSRSEADQMIDNLRAEGVRHPSGEQLSKINTGDHLYGVEIEVIPNGWSIPWERWMEVG
jgi:hypothetical protein